MKVTNTSDVDAETVVQVYVKDQTSKWEVVNTKLAGFARVALKAGESKEVAVKLDPLAFTVVTDEGKRVRDTDRFTFFIGGSQPDARSVELTGKAPLKIEITL